MNETETNRQLAKLSVRLFPQSELLRTWSLTGGFTTQMTAFEIALPSGQTKKMIKRTWSADDPLAAIRQESHVANEFKLLQQLHQYGLAVPEPYYLDLSGKLFADPYMVLAFVENKPDTAPANLDNYLRRFAAELAKIHHCDEATMDLSFLPREAQLIDRLLNRPSKATEKSISDRYVRKTLKAIARGEQTNRSVLLHGDFHADNILWQGGKIAAIVDWEFACVGDPLYDLGRSRLLVLLMAGHDAMQTFTTQYLSINQTLDLHNLPYWELCAAMFIAAYRLTEWSDPTSVETIRARHEWFTLQALEKLAA